MVWGSARLGSSGLRVLGGVGWCWGVLGMLGCQSAVISIRGGVQTSRTKYEK